MSTVAVVKGDKRDQNIRDVLSIIKEAVKKDIEGKKNILIKPNLTSIDNIYANTDVLSVQTVIEFLNGMGEPDIIIGESSGGAYYSGKTTWDIFKYFGYDALEKKYPNVRLINFDEIKPKVIKVPVETVRGKDEIRVITPPCDYSISMAIPKTHDYALVTLSLKNMMGLVFREDRLKIHGISGMEDITHPAARFVPRRFQYYLKKILPGSIIHMVKNKDNYRDNVRLIHKNLLALFRHIRPDLAIIDGYYGMEGDGPVYGDGIKHGIAIAGVDPVKADAVGAACMGFDPQDIGYLYYCAMEGLGSIRTDDIPGTPHRDVQIKYRPHRDYRYQVKWKT